MSDPRVLLLDIEGTTTPISFVYEVLFPYAREHFGSYLESHWDDPAVQQDVAALLGDAAQSAQAALQKALQLMDGDIKDSALKSLQGKIWEAGYRQGNLRGQVFADVPAQLRAWQQSGRQSYIYSSGSVLAQKLLFGHSEAGDLTPLLSGYFDTAVGPKQSPDSYRKIAETIGIKPAQGLFATDILAEAEAAHQAGWGAVVLNRPGNKPQPPHGFPVWNDFTELDNRKEPVSHG